jgi:catechol 2,3-dioxygenase-like lactoylglutathione lyase family enzyme
VATPVPRPAWLKVTSLLAGIGVLVWPILALLGILGAVAAQTVLNVGIVTAGLAYLSIRRIKADREIAMGGRAPDDREELCIQLCCAERTSGREGIVPITRLNHAVLYVRDVERSVAFYRDVLGFRPLTDGYGVIPGAAFLQAPGSTNDHDLGLFEIGAAAAPSPAGRGGSVGLYHLAWEVDTLGELDRLAGALAGAGALVGSTDHGTTKSLYGQDPDGLEFEIAWVVPADRLDPAAVEGRTKLARLDLQAELARYGAETKGGVGISH